MAVRLADQPGPDYIERILYVVREDDVSAFYPVQDLGVFRGYRVDYLAQNLTELERNLMTCQKCLGLVRDATSYHGEIRCLLCNGTRGSPVIKVSISIGNLRIKCPLLRDCDWTGKIIDCEKHLKECGSFLVECTLECGTVMKRCQNENHLKNHCLLRDAICNYCNRIFHFKDLPDHLKYCPAYPIKCKCGDEMCRGKLAKHIDTECPLTEIVCPYAKYCCKIEKILRKDLLAHKKEFYIEHQDMLEHDNCILKDECNQLQKALNEKKDVGGLKVEFTIDSTKEVQEQTRIFRMGSYEFSCNIFVCNIFMNITLTRLPSSFKNDSNIICITEYRIYLEETSTWREPFLLKEKLYTKIKTNEEILLCNLATNIYKRYIQPNGKIHLKILLDYDYIMNKRYF